MPKKEKCNKKKKKLTERKESRRKGDYIWTCVVQEDMEAID